MCHEPIGTVKSDKVTEPLTLGNRLRTRLTSTEIAGDKPVPDSYLRGWTVG